jgi:branched-chain amino acid transport system substrate-binding protein
MCVTQPLHRRPAGASAFLATLALLSACSSQEHAIRVGLAGPFSDSVGAPMRRAAELAVRQINQAGGVRGRRLELVIRDDFGDPDSAASVATALANAGVAAVIGHVYSGATLAAAPIYNSAQVLQISPSSSAPMVSSAGPWTFRVCPSDVQQAQALAQFASDHLHLQQGTILYLNNEYGRGLRRAFNVEFSRLGGQIDAEVPYLTTRPNVLPYFERLRQRDHSQFVFLAGNYDEAAPILRQARTSKLAIPFLGGDGLEGLEGEGSATDGVYISNGYLPDLDSPENRRFVQEYHSAYPDAHPPNQPAAATYDIVFLLRRELTRVGDDRRRLRDAVAEVGRGTPPFIGVTGEIAFDQNGNVPKQRVIIGRVAGGALRAVSGQ